jgi:RNA polymerase sigma factor (sigma-70 family)
MTADTLLDRYLPLAYRLAASFASRYRLDTDDAKSEAGVCLALWAPNLDALPPENYVVHQVNWYLGNWARKELRHRLLSLDDPLIDEEGYNVTKADILPDPTPSQEQQVINADLQRHVISALEKLPTEQRQLLSKHFLEEQSFAAVGAALGCSITTVKRKTDAALDRLREVI